MEGIFFGVDFFYFPTQTCHLNVKGPQKSRYTITPALRDIKCDVTKISYEGCFFSPQSNKCIPSIFILAKFWHHGSKRRFDIIKQNINNSFIGSTK